MCLWFSELGEAGRAGCAKGDGPQAAPVVLVFQQDTRGGGLWWRKGGGERKILMSLTKVLTALYSQEQLAGSYSIYKARN